MDKATILKKAEEMRNAETLELIDRSRATAMNRMARSNASVFFLSFLKDLSPYLVLALIIIVVIILAKGAKRSNVQSDPKKLSVFNQAKTRTQRIISWIKEKIALVLSKLMPGYQLRMMFSMIGGPKYSNVVPREQVKSGRCDNYRWIQLDKNNNIVIDSDGQEGRCFSAIRPKNIEWELDISKTPEFYELPEARQTQLKPKMKIVIPYDTEDSIKDGNTFFIPRCDRAYYGDDPTKKVPINQVLEDAGTTCRMVSHPIAKAAYSRSSFTKKNATF